jgi:hypothetical protein
VANFVSLGYPIYADGMEWTSLLSRQLAGGAAVWDTNASQAAVNPLGGVFSGPGSPLLTTQQASPNMSVLVNAGYVAVPHQTPGHGVYLFGLQAQSTLTIASNGAGSNRLDLIVARVHDLGNGSSSCDIEVVQGTAGNGQPATPSASFLLAVITIAPSASSIVNANIADSRTFTVAPGGILPATTSAAPPLAAGQVAWNTSLGLLERLADPITYTQTWDVAGTYTWIYPATVSSVDTEGIGGGGGGGGSDSGNRGAGGGGGAEWAADTITASPGTHLTVTVGAGGLGSPPDANTSTAGGNTTVTGGSVTLTAHGGQPGQLGGVQGLAGTGSANTRHHDGGQGGQGTTGLDSGGGGGGSGGPGSAGQAGGWGWTGGYGGYGAPAVPGGGPGGQGGNYAGDGFAPATGPGGGGGGTSGSGNIAGPGADGSVTFTWVVQPAAMTPVFSTDSSVDDLAVVDTSTGSAGSQGLSPASGSAYGWGIGFGAASGSSQDGQAVNEIQVGFDADGSTDFQIDVKWGLAVPEAAVDASSPSISNGQCRIIIAIDDYIVDTVYLRCAASGGVTQPGDGGSFTYYTSRHLGTTPSSGAHTASLAVETLHTSSGSLSGVHVGNLASVGTSSHPFGGALASYFTAALTAENCSLRVAGIMAASV